tara:strand:+ start:167 stop:304 length:138 start_codon:yes stop_codon:yes gene_type:complete
MTTKEAQMIEFCSTFELTPHFLPEQDLAPYAGYLEAQARPIPWAS